MMRYWDGSESERRSIEDSIKNAVNGAFADTVNDAVEPIAENPIDDALENLF